MRSFLIPFRFYSFFVRLISFRKFSRFVTVYLTAGLESPFYSFDTIENIFATVCGFGSSDCSPKIFKLPLAAMVQIKGK